MIILSVSVRAHACVCMCAFAGDKVIKGETTQGRVRCQKIFEYAEFRLYFVGVLALANVAK